MTETAETAACPLTQDNLAQFTSTEVWHRVQHIPHITYINGVEYLADTGGTHWLITDIIACQIEANFKKEEFQIWISEILLQKI